MNYAHPLWTALPAVFVLACNNGMPADAGGASGLPPMSTGTTGAAPTQAQSAAASADPAASGQLAATAGSGATATTATTANEAAGQTVTAQSASSHEFRTDPVPEGYLRFEPPAIELDSGDSNDWAQFVGGPLDQDYDVIDIRGVQSIGGHHALVYATTTAERPGTTRLWKEEDQITSRLMGGIGGEGGANVQFPPGVVFRVKKGSYILIQTHYLNATSGPIVGRTVMDVRLEPVDYSRTVASMMSSTSTDISLAPHAQSEKQIDCMIEKDLKFLQTANHMHDYGSTQVTDFVAPDGSVHLVKDDQSWSGDLALAPNFNKYDLDTAMVVPKGSLLRTRCTWNNTTDSEVTFPTEMCVFFGFILNDNDIYCTEGKWSESKSFGQPGAEEASAEATPASTAAEMANGTDPASSDPGMGTGDAMADPGTATGMDTDTTAADAVGCTSDADKAVMESDEFDQKTTDCATPCGLDPDVSGCTLPCLEEEVGLSHACAVCNADNIACGAKSCLSACLTNSASPACRSCVMENCDPAFKACTGT